MDSRLTIINYGKIWGKTYYEDGTWDILHASHVKPGAKAKVQYMKENDDTYLLTLLYIQPQPETATITIERNPIKVFGRSDMYRIQMDMRNKTITKEYWDINQFTMDRLLNSISFWLIDILKQR